MILMFISLCNEVWDLTYHMNTVVTFVNSKENVFASGCNTAISLTRFCLWIFYGIDVQLCKNSCTWWLCVDDRFHRTDHRDTELSAITRPGLLKQALVAGAALSLAHSLWSNNICPSKNECMHANVDLLNIFLAWLTVIWEGRNPIN